MLTLLKKAFSNFMSDRCQSMAAAIAYYTVFSLPPLLLLILMILGSVMDRETLQTGIERQLGGLMGPSGAAQVKAILEQGRENSHNGLIPTTLSVAALIFGATGVFGELQGALNIAWKVAPDPKAGGMKAFLMKRLLSFGMVLGVAFILLVSLSLSALISAFGDVVSGMFNSGLSPALMFTFDLSVSFLVFAGVFGAIYRFLPDAHITWRDVRVGAIGTTIMFLLGKFVIGFYLGRSNPGQAFGAAGSLAVMLVWVYYSAMILLYGAEFTCVWAEDKGGGIRPEPGAIRTSKAGATAPTDDSEDTRLDGVKDPHAPKDQPRKKSGVRRRDHEHARRLVRATPSGVALHERRMTELRAQKRLRRHQPGWRRAVLLVPLLGVAIRLGRAIRDHASHRPA